MENRKFSYPDRVVMSTYPFEQFTFLSDDGKHAELLSDEGTKHFRRLEFLEHYADPASSILSGVITSWAAPHLRGG